jgi:hypothetical protein
MEMEMLLLTCILYPPPPPSEQELAAMALKRRRRRNAAANNGRLQLNNYYLDQRSEMQSGYYWSFFRNNFVWPRWLLLRPPWRRQFRFFDRLPDEMLVG